MPWAGGVYTRTDGIYTGSTVCQQEQAAGLSITAPLADAREQDLATGINNCLVKDGSNTPTANLPMNGFQHTGAAAATASGQYMRWDEVVGVYQPVAANLTALGGLTFAANEIILGTGANAAEMLTFTAIAQALAALTSYPAVKGAIELHQAITASSSTLAIDMSQGWNVGLTLSASVSTITVSNWPANTSLGRLVLDVTSGGVLHACRLARNDTLDWRSRANDDQRQWRQGYLHLNKLRRRQHVPRLRRWPEYELAR
jgi:hypothetical protein